MADDRLPPPLENTVFRIIQESLNNAFRHSRSDKIRVALVRRDRRICIDVRDWGVGFDPNGVEQRRFGLQGIRERVRLLEGAWPSNRRRAREPASPSICRWLGEDDALAVIFDMDGVLIDTYRAHYRSWLEVAEAEGLAFTEAEFAATFGRTKPRDHRPCSGATADTMTPKSPSWTAARRRPSAA